MSSEEQNRDDQKRKQQSKPRAESADSARAPEPVREGEQRPQDPQGADDVMTRRLPGHEADDAKVLAASRRHTRRSFVVAAVGAAAGVSFYEWLSHGPQDNMQPIVFERGFQTNAAIARNDLLEDNLAPTYPLSCAEILRVNGVVGLKKELEPDSYRLQLVGMANAQAHPRYTDDVTAWQYRYSVAKDTEDPGHDTKTAPKPAQAQAPVDPGMDTATKMAPESMIQKVEQHQNDTEPKPEDANHTGRSPRGLGEAGESSSTLEPHTPGLLLTMDDITKLPHHEIVLQFKCIEGWSQIVRWAGVRMADFLEAYPPALINGREPRYVYMETPDGDYYVGYDMHVCRHPQTLLVTEMMGEPLTQYHGAPLRLYTPTKYGYKQIKRIGLIAYTDDKPDDYWTELGYDWYGGL